MQIHKYRVVRAFSFVTNQGSDLRHCLDPDDSFDGEIGLIHQVTGKVVGTELISWNKGICDQELGPLI